MAARDTKRTAPVAVAVALCTVVVAAWWWQNRPDPVAPLVLAADRLVAPADWQLIDAVVRGPGAGCVAAPCPGVSRRWAARQPPTVDQLQTAMRQAGWSGVRVQGDCQPRADRTGAFPLCRATARTDRAPAEVTVSRSSSTPGRPYAVTLTVG